MRRACRPGRSTRDWVVDTVLFVLVLGAGPVLSSGWFGGDAPMTRSHVLDLGLGVPACVALWWRTRWPVHIAVALSTISVFSPAADPACAAALFTVAVHRGGGTVAAVAVVNLLTPLLRMLFEPDERYPWWVPPVFTLFGTAVVISWGMWVRARRQLVESLAERARRAESEQRLRIEQARRGERTRIAREMHDTLAHRISLLSMHAGALEFRPDAPAEDISRAAGVIRRSSHQALRDLRDVLAVLREGDLDENPDRPQPGLADLGELVDSAREAGARVDEDFRFADLGEVPDTVGRNAYRIVQEALTNARKHAPRRPVRLRVSGEPGPGIRIEVRNPVARRVSGIPGSGTGLVGLSERANLAGGSLEHGVTADGEFRLSAWLPFDGSPEAEGEGDPPA
ncbi:sensor histidine kinase [Saccharopolyspora erythraea]|uniref:sensor histidine kinase n=1 Tax=Saccharopolyspora erythraea TaxID=1836 RepID=UPI001BA80AB4|nr:histidine kinase [Saccharopolyspora erythraea]